MTDKKGFQFRQFSRIANPQEQGAQETERNGSCSVIFVTEEQARMSRRNYLVYSALLRAVTL